MNKGRTSYTVGQVADLAGVTVRALRYYDEIGLLPPSGRTGAGYRRYIPADLDRLARVLYYRELGFSLGQIATILDDPSVDAAAHLRRQHALLHRRIARLQDMVAAVEHAMEANRMGISMSPEEQFEAFGDVFLTEDGFPDVPAAATDNDAYRESVRKAAGYTKEDWMRITADEQALFGRLAEVMRSGAAADSVAATNVAEEHRQHMSRYFTECTPDGHRQVCAMFVEVPSYRQTVESVAPGLSEYLRDAASANAERQSA